VFFTEKGNEFGLSDAALIGRVTAFQKSTMTYGLIANSSAERSSRLDTVIASKMK